jgi:hypothetical protein
MGEVAVEFVEAARAFRAAVADGVRDARRVRNAVARLYLAAVFLPSHTSGADATDHRDHAPLPLEESLAAIDEALVESISWFEAGLPDAVWRSREDFEQRWAAHALDVLQPLHRRVREAVG